MRIIELTSVSWRRDNQNILQDINLQVESGEHWAIIGVNGAGKTSLLNLVNGYSWPTKGTIEVLGRRYGKVNLEEVRRKIGWVSASFAEKIVQTHSNDCALDVVISGRYASIGIWVRTAAEDKTDALQILTTFQCEHLANKPFYILSQGEKQRILIARALMARPKLLILDEPCTGLDIRNRELLLDVIDELHNHADCPTLLYVTHHVEEVLPWFNRALILKGGQIVASGNKEQVLTNATLSNAFDVPIDITWQSGRPWIHVIKEVPNYE